MRERIIGCADAQRIDNKNRIVDERNASAVRGEECVVRKSERKKRKKKWVGRGRREEKGRGRKGPAGKKDWPPEGG